MKLAFAIEFLHAEARTRKERKGYSEELLEISNLSKSSTMAPKGKSFEEVFRLIQL